MVAHLFYLMLLLPAVPLARQDFRLREVSVGWLALLGVVSVAAGWCSFGLRGTMVHVAVNAGILVLFGGAMVLYHLLRRRPLQEFFTRSFGAGDALMMLAVAPIFCPTAYVRFLLVSSLAATGCWLVRRSRTVPLAGWMALTLAAYAISGTAGLWN